MEPYGTVWYKYPYFGPWSWSSMLGADFVAKKKPLRSFAKQHD